MLKLGPHIPLTEADRKAVEADRKRLFNGTKGRGDGFTFAAPFPAAASADDWGEMKELLAVSLKSLEDSGGPLDAQW